MISCAGALGFFESWRFFLSWVTGVGGSGLLLRKGRHLRGS